MNIKECLEQGYLSEEKLSLDLIEKEMKESSYDLEKAEKAFKDKDNKWAIVKCYYSMFHAAKAICFNLCYREKKHFAVLIILEHLNKIGKLESKFVNYFSAIMSLREGADYRYSYSAEKAESSLITARE